MTESANIEEVSGIAEELAERASSYRLGGYDPYPFQMEYHEGIDKSGKRALQTLLSAANQVGKTECGAADVAIHATGEYPKWWGDDWPNLSDRLRKYPEIWCGGQNNDTVRDIAQNALCGKPDDPTSWGSGWIPKKNLIGSTRKPGVPDAKESILVRHKDGFNVTIKFKCYEAALLDWAGKPVSDIWLDEEPPQAIYSQCLARTTTTMGRIRMTFTPEKGATQLVSQFINSITSQQLFILVGWEDAAHPDGRSHLDEKFLETLLAAYLPHERNMRSKGVPVLGAGMVFPVSDDLMRMDPLARIPDHWPKIVGIDFGSGGGNHPTAAVWIAFNPENRTAILYDEYKSPTTEPAVHAEAIKHRGDWIPVAWPHDGHRKLGYDGPGIANIYGSLGLKMLNNHFENPEGGNSVESGILAILIAMQEGRFKVYSTCAKWWNEYRVYHRSEKDSAIVAVNDDLMSATRYAFQSQRFAVMESWEAMLDNRPEVAEGVGEM